MSAGQQPKPTKKTDVRHIRIPEAIWIPFCEAAAEDGYGVAELVREVMREHLRERDSNSRP